MPDACLSFMKCAVIGASDNSDRYANKAALMLMNHGHEVDLYGLHPGNIQGVDIRTELEVHQQVHTVTMYVSPMKQAHWMDLLLQMKKEFGWKKVTDVLQRGNQGTVKGLYQGYENNIYTKTGTLGSYVVSLSGYIITKKGNKYVFSMLINNHYKPAAITRKAIEKYMIEIIETK